MNVFRFYIPARIRHHVSLCIAWLLVFVFAALVSALLQSCSPAQAKAAPRETARAVVLTVAEAVRTADALCATVAIRIGTEQDKRETARKLAVACADAYDVARPAVLAAATAVDAWDAGDHRGVVCGLATAGKALGSIVDAVRAAGATVPPLVEDGLRLVGTLGVCS